MFRYYFRTYSQTIAQDIPTYPTYSYNPQPYQYPTPIHSQWTTDVQQSASLTNTGNTGLGPAYQSFPHLKATYAQMQLVNDISNLSKFKTDNTKRASQMAYANLRQNRSARRDLAALHAARSHTYGEREFGLKAWYTDKPGIARRLKTQDQRRQFRLGLVSAFKFFNQLRIGDLRATLTDGDASILSSLPAGAKASVHEFREYLSLTPVIDVLNLFAPTKAAAVVRILSGIEALADFNQRLCSHLAAQPALEPIHAVLCDALRSGVDFEDCTRQNPLNIAAQAVSGSCSTPDVDAAFRKTTATTPASGSPSTNKRASSIRSRRTAPANRPVYQFGTCYDFQLNRCSRATCRFKHVCSSCGSSEHGNSSCPEDKKQ